jgi:hypothetical protein
MFGNCREIIQSGCVIALHRKFVFQVVADDANFHQVLTYRYADESGNGFVIRDFFREPGRQENRGRSEVHGK